MVEKVTKEDKVEQLTWGELLVIVEHIAYDQEAEGFSTLTDRQKITYIQNFRKDLL